MRGKVWRWLLVFALWIIVVVLLTPFLAALAMEFGLSEVRAEHARGYFSGMVVVTLFYWALGMFKMPSER